MTEYRLSTLSGSEPIPGGKVAKRKTSGRDGVRERSRAQAKPARGSVLLVDDDDAVLSIWRALLENAGFSVASTSDGGRAIALLAKDAFDAVVTDICMPDIDGLSLLRLIRETRNAGVPVIAITGNRTIETAARAIERGAFRYLLKPVEAAKLVQAVESAIRRHRSAHSRA